ncbi:fosfomycin resistance glutathione transferase [Rheinheimera sp. 4Y26]|uniref:fosfomycin resistance glutathione transferase n=1 Tax=Rheinheimera sp. 4Y26 TaxID=2977811 RepID=UPI0021B13C80|nr:fosfomycin resistance glutathione transferase [Rheinheimera sp. 4Y26]MCT6698159.1 fosfomycin resistance glutathione transferase [Rheinheimera sp. 4Y26]
MLQGLNHITIAVSDLDSSLLFYTEFVGMKAVVRWDAGAYLTLGDSWFCLSCDQVQPAQDYSHIAFSIAAEDFGPYVQKLKDAGIMEWKQNSSEGNSVYFLDPDGHKLEVHCGNLQSRLSALKAKPYAGLVWL